MDPHAADIEGIKAANQRFYDAFGALDIQMMDDLWDTTRIGFVRTPRLGTSSGMGSYSQQLVRHIRQHHADALQHSLRQCCGAWRCWLGDLL